MRLTLQSKSKEELQALGGLKGLAESLRTSLTAGAESQSDATVTLDQRRQAYGANKFKDVPQKAFLALFWENLKDPTLVLLMVAALVRYHIISLACMSTLFLQVQFADSVACKLLSLSLCGKKTCSLSTTQVQDNTDRFGMLVKHAVQHSTAQHNAAKHV